MTEDFFDNLKNDIVIDGVTGEIKFFAPNGTTTTPNKIDDGLIHNFNSKEQFVKSWEVASLIIKKDKISNNAKAFLFDIIPYIAYRTHRLEKNGEPLSIKTIALELDRDEQTIRIIIKELINKDIIALSKTKVGRKVFKEYYINPYFMCKGSCVTKETELIFHDSEYAQFSRR